MQRYHPHARLTARGRESLRRAVDEGATVVAACAAAGVSRTTYYRWRRRYAAHVNFRPRCTAGLRPRCTTRSGAGRERVLSGRHGGRHAAGEGITSFPLLRLAVSAVVGGVSGSAVPVAAGMPVAAGALPSR